MQGRRTNGNFSHFPENAHFRGGGLPNRVTKFSRSIRGIHSTIQTEINPPLVPESNPSLQAAVAPGWREFEADWRDTIFSDIPGDAGGAGAWVAWLMLPPRPLPARHGDLGLLCLRGAC